MSLNLTVTIDKDRTLIKIPDYQLQLELTTSQAAAKFQAETVCLLFAKQQLKKITTTPLLKRTNATEAVLISYGGSDFDNQDLADALLTLPQATPSAAGKSSQAIAVILERFGYRLQKLPPKKAAKARHRWFKELADKPFYLNYNGAKATVIWYKRTEMLVKAGAQLQTTVPLNQDGSVGFSARFAQKLRSEHEDAIGDAQTVKDVVLKSPNEVGLFLYFGGTNTWLQLKDSDGKTLDAWSRV